MSSIDDMLNAAAHHAVVRSALDAVSDKPWGGDGWIWERVSPGDLHSNTKDSKMAAGIVQEQIFMAKRARSGADSHRGGPAMKVEVWRNAHWFVTLYRDECCLCRSELNAGTGEWPEMIWLSMRRVDRTDNHDWREMQRVKNDLVGPEHEAVELYPAESRLVDTADQFHLWVMVDATMDFPFGWIEREVGDECHGGSQRPRE